MSIVKTKTNTYGPGTIDIQIVQGADFILPLSLKKAGVVWDLTNATLEAHLSPTWHPGQSNVPLTVTKSATPSDGTCIISLPASASVVGSTPLGVLPNPPPKPGEQFRLGNWVLNITEAGVTTRLLDGIVYLDRDPASY